MSQIIEKDDVGSAIEWYRKAKEIYADYYPFSEITLNIMGYRLLGQDKIMEAIEILKLATLEFPESWNAYDSYAEALMRAGENEAAIMYYKKSLELNPDNANAREKLKELK